MELILTLESLTAIALWEVSWRLLTSASRDGYPRSIRYSGFADDFFRIVKFMAVMIQAENLRRVFGDIVAVDDISFSVHRGDVLGFLGPNGAGKSTTMKMITGFLTPSSGKATVRDFDVVEQAREARKLIGYLPENAPLYGEMDVEDFLKFVTQIRDVPSPKDAIARATELTGIGGVLHQRIETLSKGYKRRVGLAQALLHDPQVLILDEPTDGLDPNQKHEVRTLINSMAKEKSIVLSTHILEEVDAVCNRVVIISRGKIISDSTPQELRKQSKFAGAVTLSFSTAGGEARTKELIALANVIDVSREVDPSGQERFTIFPRPGAELARAVLAESEKRKWELKSFRVESGYLDEVFRSLTISTQ